MPFIRLEKAATYKAHILQLLFVEDEQFHQNEMIT